MLCGFSHRCLLNANVKVHLCSLTHILAKGLACKIRLMRINSQLVDLWERAPAFLGAVSVPLALTGSHT